jgi:hypothetical protein
MRKGIQTFMAEAGEAACYALDIIVIAEQITGRYIDPTDALYRGIDLGHIYYNEKDPDDNNNFFVEDPAGFLSLLSWGRWTVEKAAADYQPREGEYVVERWERARTGAVTGHFRLPDWDSLADSKTVRYGKIVSKRVFRRR